MDCNFSPLIYLPSKIISPVTKSHKMYSLPHPAVQKLYLTAHKWIPFLLLLTTKERVYLGKKEPQKII